MPNKYVPFVGQPSLNGMPIRFLARDFSWQELPCQEGGIGVGASQSGALGRRTPTLHRSIHPTLEPPLEPLPRDPGFRSVP